MLARLFLGVVMSLSVLGVGVFGWIGFHQQPAPKLAIDAPVRRETRTVIVASGVVHAGELLRADDLTTRDLPADALPSGSLLDSATTRRAMVGALLRVSIPAGGTILPQDLVMPGDHGYLAAVLSPGKRAVSIGVDAVSGVAGLVWPGDYVDLILTMSMDDPGVPLGHRMAAETVLRGLRVIATDQDLVRGEKPSATGENGRTITLEASPLEAQRILIANRLGHISLSVCSLAECAADRTSPVTWSSDLSSAVAEDGGGRKDVVHLFDGTSDQKDFQFP